MKTINKRLEDARKPTSSKSSNEKEILYSKSILRDYTILREGWNKSLWLCITTELNFFRKEV